MDVIDFEIGYRQYMRERYRIYFLVAAEDYIWFIVPMLFLLAYLMVKLRNRAIYRKWEIEDTGEGEHEIDD